MIDPNDDRSLPEHPDEARARLKEIGLWPGDAQALFNKERQAAYFQFRKGNKKPTLKQTIEANYRAWMAVFTRWPPPEDSKPLDSIADYLSRETPRTSRSMRLSREAEKRFNEIGDSTDPREEVNWVYHNIWSKTVDPMQCPSWGAWEMLKTARKDRKWFYEKIHKPFAMEVVKQKNKANEQADANEPSQAEKAAVADMEAMLRDLKEQAEGAV